MPTTADTAPPEPLSAADLADRFGFTLDDLALNRAGQLSARQRQTVFYRSWGYLARGLVLVVISVGAVIAAIRAQPDANPVLTAVLVGLCAITVALLSLNAYRVLRPRVQIVTGPLRRGTDAWHPSICVAGTEIQITARRWRHLEARWLGVYRAYLDSTGHLLSIEPAKKD